MSALRGILSGILSAIACLVLIPTAAHAQASIAGVVKDTSGAVLPGVTVEATSPALIEKTRSVVTDGSGQYKVVDLRPGTYSVTFALTGFSALKREGIELAGTFTATVNADLRVGAIEETVTVSGDTPVVDIQSVTQQRVLGKEVLDAILWEGTTRISRPFRDDRPGPWRHEQPQPEHALVHGGRRATSG
jgi:hypothetical protein